MISMYVIVKYGDQVMYQHQAEKVFPGSLIDLVIAAYIEDQWKNNPEIVKKWKSLITVRGAELLDLRRTNWSVRDLVYLLVR